MSYLDDKAKQSLTPLADTGFDCASSQTDCYHLAHAAHWNGFDSIPAMLEEFAVDSIVPGVCTTCGELIDIEPDQDRGWCDECSTPTVKSIFILANLI